MKYVEIYKLNKGGSQEVLLTCMLSSDKVVFEGSENLINNLKKEGILDYSSEERRVLFPDDGLLFLEQLKYHFKSGYLNASDILEK